LVATGGFEAPAVGGLAVGVVATGFMPGAPDRRLVPLVPVVGLPALVGGLAETGGTGLVLTAVGGFDEGDTAGAALPGGLLAAGGFEATGVLG